MKVFISHSNKDDALASQIASYLEKAGLEVWYDNYEVVPGENWADKIGRGLSESDAMVVLVTPTALESNTLSRDVDYALTQKRFKGRLVPVLAGDARRFQGWSIPWIFEHLPIISLKENATSEKDFDQIAQVLKSAA
ncbi:MAG: toll/interleukin-1 receptor domain-containing protein [Pyrinomonadaceae bacterium]